MDKIRFTHIFILLILLLCIFPETARATDICEDCGEPMVSTGQGSRCQNPDCPGWVKEKPPPPQKPVSATSVSLTEPETPAFHLDDILLLFPPGDRPQLKNAAKTVPEHAFVKLLATLTIANGIQQTIETITATVGVVKQLVAFLAFCFFHSFDGISLGLNQMTDTQIRRIRQISALLEDYSQQAGSQYDPEDFIVTHGTELGLVEVIGKQENTWDEQISLITKHLHFSFDVFVVYDYPEITLILHIVPIAGGGQLDLVELTCSYLEPVILDIDKIEELLLNLVHFPLHGGQSVPNRILAFLGSPTRT